MFSYKNPEINSLMNQIEDQIQTIESNPEAVKETDQFKFCNIFFNELVTLLMHDPHNFSYEEAFNTAEKTISGFKVDIDDNLVSHDDIEKSAKHFANLASRLIILSRELRIPWLSLDQLGLSFNLNMK